LENARRLKFLRIAVCCGFLAGISGSHELWFPVERNFPRAPLFFELPGDPAVFAERFLAVALAVSLFSMIFLQRRKIFFIIALISVVCLIFLDQTRLQPWVYQYFLLLVVTAWQWDGENDSSQKLALAQILLAALYFWSGVQKMNYTFSHETLPILLAPLQNLFPSVRLPSVFLGISIALIESLAGIGLLIRRTRNLSVCLAVIMHLLILVLLIVKNYNSIVWIWNATLTALVVAAFWKSDVHVRQALQKASDRQGKAVKSVVAASVFLPVLSFAGLWDMYLSGALYSGNTPVAVVRINENLFEKLPPKARSVVFQTKTGGERMLPLFEWAINEMNVPVYPERRVFRKIARDVCKTADDQKGVELIVKQRPGILQGSYNVKRIACAEIEK
jgi:hypothetical protein